MTRWVEYERTRAGDDFIWDRRLPLRRLAGLRAPRGRRRSYPGRDHGQGPDRHRLLRALDRPPAADGPRARQGGRRRPLRASSSRRSRSAFRRRVRDRGAAAWARAPRPPTCSRCSSTCCPRTLRRAWPRSGWPRRSATRKHLTTGFLGTPYLCHVLSRYGYLDEAYLLLNREEYPSWLYPVKQGATTIWERWDGQKPDGIVPGQRR